MSHPQFEPNLTAIPEIPKVFGEDGGQFYRRYDALADELDEDMIKSLKSQLDSIIIFTGLFAGVNSAFLTLTLPDMRADPADDTNALLLQLVTGGNSTIRSADDLPSATFTPSPGIVPVNVLFSLSLTLAIIISFFAILGQQWLVYYRQRSGGGTENQRWEQLQRHLGAKRWGLETVLNDILPAFLQLDLLVFCIALVIYLQTLSKTACYVVATPIIIALEIVVRLAQYGTGDYWCPFYSTWSQIAMRGWVSQKYYLVAIALAMVSLVLSIPLMIIDGIAYGSRIIFRSIGDLFGVRRGNTSKAIQDHSHYKMVTDKVFAQPCHQPRGVGLVRLRTPIPFLHAAAIQRVLRNSNEFNILIYAAINIQAMNEGRGIQYLLQNDTVHERLEELASSPNKMLASAFSCAFSYLLLRGQQAELFVKQEHRALYHSRDSLSQVLRDTESHPLEREVRFICNQLDNCVESSEIRGDNFVGVRLYFELLKLILDPRSDNQKFSACLDRVTQKQEPAQVLKPLVICLIASTVGILDTGIESVGAPSIGWESRLPQDPEREGQYQERLLNVIQERVEMAKKFIRTIDQRVKLYSTPGDRTDAPWLMQAAPSTDIFESSRHHNIVKIRLLERALLLSAQGRHEFIGKFVLRTSIGLLLWLDGCETPTPDSVNLQDSQNKYNRLRCAKVLSQCLQGMRQHLEPDEFIRAVSPALDILVDYWARFEDDFAQNPDLNDSEMLTIWLEIRGALDKPEESGWGPSRSRRFGEAYPSLKAGFEAMVSAMSPIETIPQVDNSTEHPGDAALDGQPRRTEPDEAVADRTPPTSINHLDLPLEDAGERREHEDARERNSGERNEQIGKQAGDANPKPMDEDE